MTKSTQYSDYNEKVQDEVIGRVREIQPMLLRTAQQADIDRRLSDEAFAAATDAGVWAMATPRRWGGLGASATAMTLVGAELSKGNPSLGWISLVLHGGTWLASVGPDALQEIVFGDSETPPVICGVFNPPGTAEEVDGGYLINGSWPYASGCRHASWAQLGVNIRKRDGTIEPGGFAYLRREQYRIDDTWYPIGLRATGSETIVAKDVFIPTAQFFHTTKLGIGVHSPDKRYVGEPADYWPFLPFLRGALLGVMVGASMAIRERVTEAASKRPIIYTNYARQADAVMAQGELGKAAAKLNAAEALVINNCGLIDQAGRSRVPMTPQQRVRSKGEAAITVDLISSAVDQLMFLAGSGAMMDSNPIQRFYRDVVFGLRHTAVLPYVGYEVYGKGLLEIEPNISAPEFI